MSDAPAGEAPAAPAKSKMLVIVLCSVLAAGATGGGVFFMTSKKGDDKAAEKVLDVALARNKNADPIDRARALAART